MTHCLPASVLTFLMSPLQPFKLGDRVGVAYSSAAPSLAGGAQGAWFEGVCEKVDLRCVSNHYTLFPTFTDSC